MRLIIIIFGAIDFRGKKEKAEKKKFGEQHIVIFVKKKIFCSEMSVTLFPPLAAASPEMGACMRMRTYV